MLHSCVELVKIFSMTAFHFLFILSVKLQTVRSPHSILCFLFSYYSFHSCSCTHSLIALFRSPVVAQQIQYQANTDIFASKQAGPPYEQLSSHYYRKTYLYKPTPLINQRNIGPNLKHGSEKHKAVLNRNSHCSFTAKKFDMKT